MPESAYIFDTIIVMNYENQAQSHSNELQEASAETTERKRSIAEAAESISELFVSAAETYLQGDPELRDAVQSFYGDVSRLRNEFSNVFSKSEQSDIQIALETAKELVNSEEKFRSFAEKHIEVFQSTTERSDSFRRRDKRIQENPIATAPEYALGSYKEAMESQVADAVFQLHQKGYSPFESGMIENIHERGQYIGFYDENITVQESLITHLDEHGFVVKIDKQDNRIKLFIHPKRKGNVRLSEWKAVWDTVADNLEQKEREDMSGKKIYTYHQEFREYQDKL